MAPVWQGQGANLSEVPPLVALKAGLADPRRQGSCAPTLEVLNSDEERA